jgi:drug/metabolite transporter (DMT)-like permease
MTHRQATLALIGITVLWGVSITALKGLLGTASPMLAMGVRFGIAGLLLSPTLRGATRREVRGGAIIGLVFATGAVFQNFGLVTTTASRSAFIIALSAILTPALSALILRHQVPLDIVRRIGIALAGVYVLTAPADGLSGINPGDVLTLVSAAFYGGHIVAVGHYARGSSALPVLAIQFLVTATVGLALSPLLESPRIDFGPVFAGLVAYLVFSSMVTFGFQLRAQRVVSSSEAALVFTFEPVVTAATSYFAFGETLSALQFAGGALIMLAVGWPRRAARDP